MRAALRLSVVFLLTGLALGPLPVFAQDAQAPAETPATDAVGPRELENFSIQGTVTRQADEPPAVQQPPARTPPAASTRDDRSRASAPVATEARGQESRATDAPSAAPAARNAERPSAMPGQSSVTVSLPPVSGDATTSPAADMGSGDLTADPSLPSEQGPPNWLWLLAAMALGAGGAFLFLRNRQREAFASGPATDAFVAPQPQPRAPSPVPVPVAKPAPTPEQAPSGVVSTRLRPWIDLTFEPRRCVVEDERVTFEFDLSMMNSGSAPARDVLIEASTFNAGPTQDEEIEAFFTNPIGEGERIATIPPLKSFSLRTQVSVERSQVRVLEAGGRHVFVPLMAFNAVYSWGSGEGQTSEAFLLGRDTQGEKMAPFRLDLGSRVFRGVGKRALPAAIRR